MKAYTSNTMRIVELKNQKEGFELDIKRFYPTGSYTVICLTCQSCDIEYQLPIKLKSMSVEIEFDENNLNKHE